jgi:uncharacterized membrane protein (DUF485 family)
MPSYTWVDVGSFHTCLVVRFIIFTASVRNILDTPSYVGVCVCVTVSVAFLVILTTVLCCSKYVGRSTEESEDRIADSDD